jgi:membrane-bound acyltransferase YfiQ involved in biofilm formation
VLAHYIRFHLDWDRARKLKVGAASFIAGAFFTVWSFWLKGEPGVLIETPLLEWGWEFCTPNVLLATFGLFLMFTCIEQKQAPAIVTETSKLSFGMYLVHMFFLAPIATFFVAGDRANPIIPVWLAIPVIAILTYICSWAAIKILSYLPGSKYFVGYEK